MAAAPLEPVHAADELEELRAGETVEEQRFVGDEADAALDLEIIAGQLEAEDLDGAAVGGNEAGEHADGGRFAGAIGAEEAEERAARDLQVDAVHGGLRAVKLLQIAGEDGGRGMLSARRRGRRGTKRRPPHRSA